MSLAPPHPQFKLLGNTKALEGHGWGRDDAGPQPWVMVWQENPLKLPFPWSEVTLQVRQTPLLLGPLWTQVFLLCSELSASSLWGPSSCPKGYNKARPKCRDLGCLNSPPSSLGEIFFSLGWGWGEGLKSLTLLLLFQDTYFSTKESLPVIFASSKNLPSFKELRFFF